jgi:hypothetical protein
MRQARPLTRVALSLGVIALLASPGTASAQTFYGLSAGLNYSGPAPAGDTFTQGFAVQASVGRQLVPGLSVRLDAFTSRFDDSRPTVACPCPSFSPGCCAGFAKPVGVAGLMANGLMNLQPPVAGVGMYLIVGAGVDYLYQHPSAEGAVWPDLSAGAGVTVQVASRSQLFLEARYHDLLGTPSSPSWLVPVTFGIRF